MLRDEKPRVASALAQAAIDLQGNDLNITFPQDYRHFYETAKNNSESIKNLAGKMLQREIQVQLDLSKEVSEEKAKSDKIKNDAKLNNLAEAVKGKIVSIDNIKGE